MAKCVEALKGWTEKRNVAVLYDSMVDELTDDGLFRSVVGKPNVAVVAFTTDGDVFGAFYSVAVTEQWREFPDPSIFAFSFESHGRCMTPQRFVLKPDAKEKAAVEFFKESFKRWFVRFRFRGADGFDFGDPQSDTCCVNLSDVFEGMDDTTLTGTTDQLEAGNPFRCERLLAVQLD